jgi:serine phosphatase RsbU (regulator of sigma subunit)
MAPRPSARTLFNRLILRPILFAVPFAFFNAILFGSRWADLPDYYLGSLLFSFVISAMIEINRAWVAPRLVPPERKRPGHPLEIASFAFAAVAGSVLSAAILHFTIAPGSFGSGRAILIFLVFTGLFTVLFLAVIYWRRTQSLYVQRVREEAERQAREDQELRMAAAVQQALLPPGKRSGRTYRSAGASIPCRTIGGDFFETFDLPGERLGFALGDVAGKGPSAAILAGLVQGVFASHLADGDGPAATLTRVNRALCRRVVETRFATIAYLILGPNGALRSSSAGHPPACIVPREGPARFLDRGGLLAGAFENAAYEEETVGLRPGDTVLLYSDGLSDAESPSGEQFGDDRLRAALLTAARADAPERVLDQVLQTVQAFTAGQPPADDITLLVVRYDGEG